MLFSLLLQPSCYTDLHRRPLHTNVVGTAGPSEVSVPVTSTPEANADSNTHPVPLQDQIVPS